MKILIEVGAFKGDFSLNYLINGYCVYTFEPSKDLYSKLIQRTEHISCYKVFYKAISSKDGKTLFNVCRYNGGSIYLVEKKFPPSKWDITTTGESYEVETIRLDTFLLVNGLENIIIDYIKIDAGNSNLDIIKSLGKYINNIIEGEIETNIDTISFVTKILEENNFKIVNIVSSNYRGSECNVYFRKN